MSAPLKNLSQPDPINSGDVDSKRFAAKNMQKNRCVSNLTLKNSVNSNQCPKKSKIIKLFNNLIKSIGCSEGVFFGKSIK